MVHRVTKGACLVSAAVMALVSAPAVSASTLQLSPPAVPPPVSVDHSASQWVNRAFPIAAIHDAGFTGKGVRVGVIDTVVDTSHGDLAGRVVENYVFVDGVPVDDTASYKSPSGHGTHVASIIAGSDDSYGITGVAPEVDLVTVGLPSVDGYGTLEGVITDITSAITFLAGKVDVINMSLGGSAFDTWVPEKRQLQRLCDATALAHKAGTVVVATAGNEGSFVNLPSQPGSCEGVVSVSAVDAGLNSTYWSSFDGSVDIAGPGSQIAGAFDRNAIEFLGEQFVDKETHPVVAMSGTSMAAPFVVGVAALVKQKNPTFTSDQIVDVLVSSAKDSGPVGLDPRYGAGIVNPAAALNLPLPQPTPVGYAAVLAIGALDDSTMYLSWDAPTAGDRVLSYEVSFTRADNRQTTSLTTVDGGTPRATIPLVKEAGWWVITATTTNGTFTSTPFPTPGIVDGNPYREDITLHIEGKDATGRVVVNWKSLRPITEDQVIWVYPEWDYPTGYKFTEFQGASLTVKVPAGKTSGTFTLDPARYIKEYGYNPITGEQKERYATLRGNAAKAVRDYVLAGAISASACIVDKDTMQPVSNMFSCTWTYTDPINPVRAFFLENRDGSTQLFLNVNPAMAPLEFANIRVTVPGARMGPKHVALTSGGLGTIRLPAADSENVRAFTIRADGIKGLHPKKPTTLYALKAR